MLVPVARDGLTDADIDDAYAWPGWPQPEPWLRANMVSTADGAGRGPSGLSESISSAADKRVFGRLRGLADVILVGAGTARAEGYRAPTPKADFLERRRGAGQAAVPAVALVSRSLDLDLDSALIASPLVRTIVVTCAASDLVRRAEVAAVADVVVAGDHSVDPVSAVAALHARGLVRIHAEGGPTLLADLVSAGVLDELLLTVSPVVAGGTYPGDVAIPRILAGSSLSDPPLPVTLGHVLEDGGSLFLRYGLR